MILITQVHNIAVVSILAMASDKFHHPYLRYLMTGIVATLCAGGFAWLVWHQVIFVLNYKMVNNYALFSGREVHK